MKTGFTKFTEVIGSKGKIMFHPPIKDDRVVHVLKKVSDDGLGNQTIVTTTFKGSAIQDSQTETIGTGAIEGNPGVTTTEEYVNSYAEWDFSRNVIKELKLYNTAGGFKVFINDSPNYILIRERIYARQGNVDEIEIKDTAIQNLRIEFAYDIVKEFDYRKEKFYSDDEHIGIEWIAYR